MAKHNVAATIVWPEGEPGKARFANSRFSVEWAKFRLGWPNFVRGLPNRVRVADLFSVSPGESAEDIAKQLERIIGTWD